MSAVTLVGKRIGKTASSGPARGRTVRLAQAASASAVLRVVNVGNYPVSRCRPALAAGLRVYAPGDRVSKVVPFSFRVCRRTDVSVLGVDAVRSGTR